MRIKKTDDLKESKKGKMSQKCRKKVIKGEVENEGRKLKKKDLK